MIEKSTASVDRKAAETRFHDELRGERSGDERLHANDKYYSVTKSSEQFVVDWLGERCRGKKVLDYGCGNGEFTRLLAQGGADAYGIDISPVSVDIARKAAEQQGLAKCATFEVMDAEATEFPDNYFDYVHVGGVLHHLDLMPAYRELARILKPDGAAICAEALKHNPILHLYRKLTPHLRTAWEVEHILGRSEIYSATSYFEEVRVLKCFNLLSIAAAPLRNTPAFKPAVRILEGIDDVLLRLPGLKWQAWIVVFLLAKPKRAPLYEAMAGQGVTTEMPLSRKGI